MQEAPHPPAFRVLSRSTARRLPGPPGPGPLLPACSSTLVRRASRLWGRITRLERCIAGPRGALLAPRGTRLTSRCASLAPPLSYLARGGHPKPGWAPLSPRGVNVATREASGSPRRAHRPRRPCGRAPPSCRCPQSGRGSSRGVRSCRGALQVPGGSELVGAGASRAELDLGKDGRPAGVVFPLDVRHPIRWAWTS